MRGSVEETRPGPQLLVPCTSWSDLPPRLPQPSFPAIGVTEASVRLPQFLSQPFLVGDRVEVATGTGAKVLTGVVERIDPMRTIVRSDVDVPITIPNKASRLTPCAFPSPSHTPLSIAENTHSPVQQVERSLASTCTCWQSNLCKGSIDNQERNSWQSCVH